VSHPETIDLAAAGAHRCASEAPVEQVLREPENAQRRPDRPQGSVGRGSAPPSERGEGRRKAMASVPIHIPIHIRIHERRGSPPDVTVEPTCVHANTRDTLEWDLQGGGRFRIALLEGKTPFGSAFELISASDGCCSAMVAFNAEPGTYHYSLDGDTVRVIAPARVEASGARAGIPAHFEVSGSAEMVIQ
jgi:hypothetical protein